MIHHNKANRKDKCRKSTYCPAIVLERPHWKQMTISLCKAVRADHPMRAVMLSRTSTLCVLGMWRYQKPRPNLRKHDPTHHHAMNSHSPLTWSDEAEAIEYGPRAIARSQSIQMGWALEQSESHDKSRTVISRWARRYAAESSCISILRGVKQLGTQKS